MSLAPTSKSQGGFALMEALIGVLLITILGLGMTYTTSSVLISQNKTEAQSSALTSMRTLLEQQGTALCGAAAPMILVPPDHDLEVEVTCTEPESPSIGGVTLDAPPMLVQLSVTDETLFGGTGTIVAGDLN